MSENACIESNAPDYGSAPRQIQMTPALTALENLTSVQIEEKASVIEAITQLLGTEIEMPNRYMIYASGEDGEKSHEIFYAVEETDFCTRQMQGLCRDCAPWNVTIFHIEGGQNEKAFSMTRPCTFTCCCFNRPIVHVKDEVANQDLGSIRDPWVCCPWDMTLTIMDSNDRDIFHAKGGCCQWGMWCPLPCGPCSTVSFPLMEASSETSVGTVTKKIPSCLTWLFASDVDNYMVDFANVEDPRAKALITALAIFLDFRYFNRTDEPETKA